MNVQHGKLITLEGIEGAGKSSVIAAIDQFCIENGKKTIVSHEPGGTMIAEKIRGVLLAKEDEPLDAITETLLMWAARRQHWVQVLQPAINAGTWIICDRFVDSSYAYQHYGRGIDSKIISFLHQEVVHSYQPDITILFDIDPLAGMERIRSSRKELDRIEQQNDRFFYRVRDGYQQLARKYPERIFSIDATQNVGNVIDDAKAIVTRFIQSDRQQNKGIQL